MALKPVPVIVTLLPIRPLVGLNEVMVGAGVKVKIPELIAVPPNVFTPIAPVAPLPKVAVICVSEFTINELANVKPMLTPVVVSRFVPEMITVFPVPPFVGVKLLMVGAGIKLYVSALTAVPPGVVMLIVPVVPFPTIAVTLFASTTVTELAEVPPILTAVVPVR